jgi:hypothetical protein
LDYTTQCLLKRCYAEFNSILEDINNDKIPFDGDDFHEILRDLREALGMD